MKKQFDQRKPLVDNPAIRILITPTAEEQQQMFRKQLADQCKDDIDRKRKQRQHMMDLQQATKAMKVEAEHLDDKTKYRYLYRSSLVMLVAFEIMRQIRSVVVQAEKYKVAHSGANDNDRKMKQALTEMRVFLDSVDKTFIYMRGSKFLKGLYSIRDNMINIIVKEISKMADKFESNIQKLYGISDSNMSSLLGYGLMAIEMAKMSEAFSLEESLALNAIHEQNGSSVRYNNTTTALLSKEVEKLTTQVLSLLGFNANSQIFSANVRKCTKAVEEKINMIDYTKIKCDE